MTGHPDGPAGLRNVAIIAHVDHGKTTLVDQLLRQSGALRSNQQVAERALDSGDLERERGITILAKCTSVAWRDLRLNIVDTPGHADFGGEVERILSMVDGVLLLVDAAEGPMPQTKFVTMKALARGLRPIVVVNKVDRPDARPYEVQSEVFDLFAALDASEEQLEFPTLFASAKQGWAAAEPTGRDAEGALAGPGGSLTPLFELIAGQVPPPPGDPGDDAGGAFAMVASLLDSDPYLGRVLTGRVQSGVARVNMPVKVLRGPSETAGGQTVEQGRLTKLLGYRGLAREPLEEARAGDIVAVAGLTAATVPDTIAAPEVAEAIPAQPVDPPTLSMTFSVNDSPLAGREGSKVTGRMIGDRLLREAEGNVAIRVTASSERDAYEVAGRGELQLGVLIETMRREGYELSISRPQVITRADAVSGQRLEPIEELQVDVDEDFAGVVVEALGERRAEMTDMRPSGGGKTRITFLVPSRGLIGYHGEFLTSTRGTGVMNRIFHGYAPHRGAIQGRRNGVLISNAAGRAVAYALWNLEDRGPMFIGAGAAVYPGMIIGEHSRGTDLEVNPLKAKQLTNIRAAGKDEAVRLTPPRPMPLEAALSYIQDDELVEVTPASVRLRKRELDPHERKKQSRLKDAG